MQRVIHCNTYNAQLREGITGTLAPPEISDQYGSRMSRYIDPSNFTPPATCLACRKHACSLDQAGIVCYHCAKGILLHRRFWTYARAPHPLLGDRQFDAELQEWATDEAIHEEVWEAKVRAVQNNFLIEADRLSVYDSIIQKYDRPPPVIPKPPYSS